MKLKVVQACILMLVSLMTKAAPTLTLELGQTRLIDRVGVSEILLGNGNVATVRPIDKRRALVVSTATGKTEMYFMQQNGSVKTAYLSVVEPGTSGGGMALRLVVVEQSQGNASQTGLATNVGIQGQFANRTGGLTAQGSLSWLPGQSDQQGRIVARPKILLQPGKLAALDVGGEIQRSGADGATEDKEYGLNLEAEFVWSGESGVRLTHSMTLRSPSGDGQFKRQRLAQTLDMGVGQVVELARFDGMELSQTESQNGLPIKRSESDSSQVSWRVIGWLEYPEGTR